MLFLRIAGTAFIIGVLYAAFGESPFANDLWNILKGLFFDLKAAFADAGGDFWGLLQSLWQANQ